MFKCEIERYYDFTKWFFLAGNVKFVPLNVGHRLTLSFPILSHNEALIAFPTPLLGERENILNLNLR